MIIEEYTTKDLKDFKEFYKQILTESDHFSPYEVELGDKFIAPKRFKYIIRDGKVIAHLTFYPNDDEGYTYTIGVAVLKNYYGRGLASMLLDFASEKCRQMGVTYLIANIDQNNWRSLLLFVKNGYKVVGENAILRLEKKL